MSDHFIEHDLHFRVTEVANLTEFKAVIPKIMDPLGFMAYSIDTMRWTPSEVQTLGGGEKWDVEVTATGRTLAP